MVASKMGGRKGNLVLQLRLHAIATVCPERNLDEKSGRASCREAWPERNINVRYMA